MLHPLRIVPITSGALEEKLQESSQVALHLERPHVLPIAVSWHETSHLPLLVHFLHGSKGTFYG